MPESATFGRTFEVAEERLARISVLQELILAAHDLFDPSQPIDMFLEHLAERIGCTTALWLSAAPGETCLVAAAGLSARSRTRVLPSSTGETDWTTAPLPFPEVAEPSVQRWVFPFSVASARGDATHHTLLLCFERQPGVSAHYRPIIRRLVGVLEQAFTHRQTLADLRRSYEDLARMQRALVDRERLVALGELSAVVAHEVRNPLAVMFNSLSGLAKFGPRNDEEKQLLEILKSEAEHLNDIVRDLLVFAKPCPLTKSSESIAEVIQSAIEDERRQAQKPGVELRLDVDQTLPRVAVDPQLLRQALVNLVSNAVQALTVGGHVTVRATLDEQEQGRAIRIDVMDDGPGITSDVRARIFEPFFTTKPQGTGLGLAIVKRIVEAHEGAVTASATAGGGATFTIRLPLRTPSGPAP